MLAFKVFLDNRKYLSSAIFYICFSLLFSTWVTYIPHVCDKLSLSEGRFGSALFFSALGSFIMIPISNKLINRIGVGRMVFFALLYFCFAVLSPLLAFNYASLCVALFLLGTGTCLLNISINSLTGTIEKADKVMIMSASHGFFSAGGMIGASIGGIIAAKLNNPVLHYGIVIALLIGIQTYLRKHYYNIRGEQLERKKILLSSFQPLVIIALVGLIVMVAEGAIADWSALYLKHVVHVDVAMYGFGFAAFSFAMTVGRFLGDWISHRYGSWQIIAGGSFLSLLGFIMVLTVQPFITIGGFAIIGFGFSTIVPEIYRIAARTKNIETSTGVSFIAGVANIGFLIGPVLIGLLAELQSLRFSYFFLACFVSVAVIIAVYQLIKNKPTA
jgi:predicted MFS family arabinose efflux permease